MVKTPGFQCSVGAELIAGGEPQAMAKKKKRGKEAQIPEDKFHTSLYE